MKIKIIRLFMLGVLVFLSAACEQEKIVEPSGDSVKIGVIAPFSGSDFSKGEEGLNGIHTALRMNPLLKNGDRIELVTKDDQDDPDKSIKALQELVETENVTAVFTLSSSGPVLAMSRVADSYQTPILVALATHPEVTSNNEYVSQACFDNTLQGKVAALFVRDELLVDKVAVFLSPSSYYSSNLATEFIRRFTSLEGEITDRLALDEESADVSKMLTAVKEKEPELLYLPVSAKHVLAINEEVRRMGWKVKLMGSDGLLATVISQHTDKLDSLDGIMATEFYHHTSQLTPFGKRAAKVHEGKGTSYTAMAIEGFSIVVDAMNRCDNPYDRDCINRKIRSTVDFEGLIGKISIDENGKAHRPVVINAIKNKKTKYIVKVY